MKQFGPFTTTSGITYWVRIFSNPAIEPRVGFDIDADPDPDIFIPLSAFNNDASVDQLDKDEVNNKIVELSGPVVIDVGPPVGVNNRSNPYYARVNHIRLAKKDSNKSQFFGTVGGV